MGRIWHTVFCVTPDANQRAKVAQLAREADALGARAGDSWLRVTAKFALAQDAVARSNPRRIRVYVDELLELYRQDGDNRAKALASLVLAEMHALNMNYDAALACAAECKLLTLTPIDRYNVIATEGVAIALAEKSADAYALLRPVRALLEQNEVNIAALLLEMPFGVAQIGLAQIGRGIRTIKRAARRFRRWGYTMGERDCHLYLGEVYTRIALRDGELSPTQMLRNIGFIISQLPFAAMIARHHLRRSIALNERFASPSYAAWSTLNLGRLEFAARRYTRAIGYFTRALNIATDVDAHAVVAGADWNLGLVHRALGAPEAARAHFVRSLAVARRAGASMLEVKALISLGESAEQAGEGGPARALYEEAMQALLALDSPSVPRLRSELVAALRRA